MHCSARLSLFACLTMIPTVLPAQGTAEAPAFNVLRVYRETVKPGKGAAHDAHETAWARAMAAAKNPDPYLAITAMSGAPESWYLSAYLTWADYEKANQAGEAPALAAIGKQFGSQEGEYLSDGRAMVLTYRADLSYGGPADLPASRYFTITRVSVRPGHDAEYEENRKMVKAAHEAGKLADKYSMWQAAAGAPAGTYFIFVARKSLAEIDQGAAIHGDAYRAALGGPDAMKKMAANAAAAIISSQTDHFAFAPQQSNAPAEWVTTDPAYWKLKAPAPKKTP
jgi:hypothetical protein